MMLGYTYDQWEYFFTMFEAAICGVALLIITYRWMRGKETGL